MELVNLSHADQTDIAWMNALKKHWLLAAPYVGDGFSIICACGAMFNDTPTLAAAAETIALHVYALVNGQRKGRGK